MFHVVNALVGSFSQRSVVALIIANLLPLYGVYYLGWSISQIVILYWFENVIIGFYNVLKMLYNTKQDIGEVLVNGKPVQGSLTAVKAFMIPFFIMHYGLFTFVHGVFIFIFFVFSIEQGDIAGSRDIGYLFLNGLMIFISHGISFFTNYIGNDEKSRTDISTLMFSPYLRIVAMQLVVIFGGMIYMNTGRNDVSLYILIIFKIFTDAWSHIKQHVKLQTKFIQQ